MILILDIDGVLITTPAWRPVPMEDGFSVFKEELVENLKTLLENSFEIWLSSSRRKEISLEDLNKVFKLRGIQQITGYLPEVEGSRKDSIESFIQDKENYLIIDDDKSLNGLEDKSRLILTKYHLGFNKEKLEEALYKI